MKSGKTTTRRKIVEAELVAIAAAVFAQSGYRRATLEEIAARLGVTRAALYTYVTSKEDLLRRVIEPFYLWASTYLRDLDEVRDLPPADQLHHAIRMHVDLFEKSGDTVRVFIRTRAELPPELFRRHRSWERKLHERVCEIVEEGIRIGDFRPVNVNVATYTIYGATNWMHMWHGPTSAAGSADEIADALTDLIVAGLRSGNHDARRYSASATIDEIRSALDRLSDQIETGAARKRSTT